mmetsp:Transcript_24093/g.52776  ORF Transcript_24093/g.52776 Transcript_24093/m.52776 type:complete len:157 (-) Transcript_24093:1668-2138(-)
MGLLRQDLPDDRKERAGFELFAEGNATQRKCATAIGFGGRCTRFDSSGQYWKVSMDSFVCWKIDEKPNFELQCLTVGGVELVGRRQRISRERICTHTHKEGWEDLRFRERRMLCFAVVAGGCLESPANDLETSRDGEDGFDSIPSSANGSEDSIPS